jgi:hypothetical protein
VSDGVNDHVFYQDNSSAIQQVMYSGSSITAGESPVQASIGSPLSAARASSGLDRATILLFEDQKNQSLVSFLSLPDDTTEDTISGVWRM